MIHRKTGKKVEGACKLNERSSHKLKLCTGNFANTLKDHKC